MTTHILVVDDDPSLREVVRYALARAGFTVHEAADGAQALRHLAATPTDLVVLDVAMPELDGLETCRRLRTFSRTPVVFLSSKAEEVDRILGLELGGDDYITKPFSPRELVSRVKAVLRRTQAPPPGPPTAAPPRPTAPAGPLRAGPLSLDPTTHRVHVADTEVHLTATEFRLLHALLAQPGRVYDRDALRRAAYPDARFVADRTLDSHVRRVRAKLREADLDPIETVRGVGYRLAEPSDR